MRVCFWSTSFSADNQALAHYLSHQPGFEVVVAMDRHDAYLREPVHRFLRFEGRVVDRARRSERRALADAADLLVLDNHVPAFVIAPRVFVLWHGFGWRTDDLSAMRRDLAAHVGDVTMPNDRFRWSAFGKWDRRYRVDHSGLAPENVVASGSPYSDLLLPGSTLRTHFDRSAVQDCYRIDLTRPTVLLAPTWHHGRAFGHWGDDGKLTEAYLEHVASRGANVLLRMHDRHRYQKRYARDVEALVARHPHVQVKFKSDSVDSLVDLLVSDLLVSNYSSVLNSFYFTGRPTIHVDPRPPSRADTVFRTMRRGKVRIGRVSDPESSWKLSPDETGGLRARAFSDLLAKTDRALADPQCCAASARDYCDRYISDVDGKSSRRMASFLQTWAGP